MKTELLEALAMLEQELLGAAQDEPDPAVRDAWLALFATWRRTGGLGDGATARALAIRSLASLGVPDVPTRGALALLATLSRPGAPEPPASWPEVLATEPHSLALEDRVAIAGALTTLDAQAPRALLGALLVDPSPLVRAAIARGIADRHLPLPDELVADLFDLVHDPLPDVASAATAAILAQRRADLVRRLEGDPTPHVQRALRAAAPSP